MHPLMPTHAWVGAIGALALAVCLIIGWSIPALVVAWLCAYSWGALLVEGISRLPAIQRRRYYRRWEGRYYEFDGRQMRVEEGADGEPWLQLEDALAAMGLSRAGLHLGGLTALELRHAGDGGEQISLAGLKRLQRAARSPAAPRFVRWFERSVHLPAMNRLGRPHVHSPDVPP